MSFIGNLFKKVKAALPKPQAELKIKQELHATIIRACRECGAPGVDSKGVDVGKFCPWCGTKRPKPESLGRIWAKYRD